MIRFVVGRVSVQWVSFDRASYPLMEIIPIKKSDYVWVFRTILEIRNSIDETSDNKHEKTRLERRVFCI